ncbi:unnamed protein product [Polarella glacialis]|uniref:Uncharacterized protein n=1 Tax=Polarella glacialis TaxID=89957 RepID=A0A813JJQ0_POLGL|nr:unnamed protein product [Polarella glacialis]
MSENRRVTLCAMAAAAAGAFAVTSSTGFAVSRGAAGIANQHAVTGLRGATEQAPAGGSMGSTVLGLAGIGALAAAAVSGKVRVARRGVGDIVVADDGMFAGGLAGSKNHGFGEYQWDPVGIAGRYPQHLPWYREAELKHGRVAMLAFAGLLAPDAVRLPFDVLQNTDLDFVNAHNKLIGPGLGEGPMWWLLLGCGVLESVRFKQMGLGFEKLTLENAGDFGLKSFAPKTAEGYEIMQTKELKNGRLAMMAVSGIMTQGVLWESHHFPWTAN